MESKNKMVNFDSKFRRQLEEALEAVRLSGLQDFAGIALSNVVRPLSLRHSEERPPRGTGSGGKYGWRNQACR